MVKNQKKPLVAASRDELLCVALPVIHELLVSLFFRRKTRYSGKSLDSSFGLKHLE